MKYLNLLLFCILLTSCQSENAKNTTVPKAEISHTKVTIAAVSNDPEVFQSLNLLNPSYFFTANHRPLLKEVHQDTTKIFLHNIQTPQIVPILTYGKEHYYSTRVFVTPGDSVSVEFQNGRILFSGKYSQHYNFFYSLDSTDLEWAKLKFKSYTGDIEQYKQQCDSLYQKRLHFLNSYIKKHPSVSEQFVQSVQDELKFEYLRNLISPRFEPQAGYYINTARDLDDLLANSNRQEGRLFNLNAYVNHISIEDFNRPELIRNDYFKMSLVPFIRQYFVRSQQNPYSKEAFQEEVDFIQKNLSKEIADLAIGKLIVAYHEKGLGSDQNSRQYFKDFLSEFIAGLQEDSYIRSMKDIEHSLSALQSQLSSTLKQSLIQTNKDTIDIQTLLNSPKVKVFDFWASWCRPCLDDFEDSKEIRQRLESEYDVAFIYLSLDADFEPWIKASNRYKSILGKHNYQLENPKKSPFIKTLKITSNYGISIPRYVIVNTKNIVIDNNAPKPSSPEFEMILKKAN